MLHEGVSSLDYLLLVYFFIHHFETLHTSNEGTRMLCENNILLVSVENKMVKRYVKFQNDRSIK